MTAGFSDEPEVDREPDVQPDAAPEVKPEEEEEDGVSAGLVEKGETFPDAEALFPLPDLPTRDGVQVLNGEPVYAKTYKVQCPSAEFTDSMNVNLQRGVVDEAHANGRNVIGVPDLVDVRDNEDGSAMYTYTVGVDV